mgnify:FL=1
MQKTGKMLSGVILVAGIAAILLFTQESAVSVPADGEGAAAALTGPVIAIGDVAIPVELATTTVAVTKGLGGRDALTEDSGMLFIFEERQSCL